MKIKFWDFCIGEKIQLLLRWPRAKLFLSSLAMTLKISRLYYVRLVT